MAQRRKRSQSVADLPVRGKGKAKAEESGYDSDVTRKSSPPSSLKNCGGESSNSGAKTGDDCSSSSNKDTDSVSSGFEDSGAAQMKQQPERYVSLEEKSIYFGNLHLWHKRYNCYQRNGIEMRVI